MTMAEFPSRCEKSKNSVLSVDEKTIFLPFRDIQKLQPVDLDRKYRKNEIAIVLRQEINFKGIDGAVGIYTYSFLPEKDFLTPFGTAHLTKTYSDGSEHITEAPCFMRIEFYIATQEQFDTLGNYRAQVFLNDDVYYLDCDGGVNPEFAFHEFKKRKTVFARDWKFKDKNGRKVDYVLLPQNASVLSAIRMRFIDYGDDNDGGDEEMNINPPPIPEFLKTS